MGRRTIRATQHHGHDRQHGRRRFLSTAVAGATGAVGSALLAPYRFTSAADETDAPSTANDRWRIGSIGMRYQGSVITREALPFGDVVAISDVDRHVREQARASFGSTPKIYEDYQDLLARDDIDVVLIAAPDHWHAKMLIDACRAGKDVYCEKPLTLTVDEGKLVTKVVEETGRVVQVGTWQRSDHNFRLGCEMVRAGRIGALQKVTVLMGRNKTGGPFETRRVPNHINWDRWQGQTPDVPYIEERCHYTFRWWYEYSGGEMTDSGAHHIDIAQWGMGMQHTGPVEITTEANFPDAANGRSYNVALDYHATYRYANDVILEVIDSPRGDYDRNGIMFEGEEGRIFVNRGTVAGKPVEELASNPFEQGEFELYDFDNVERPIRTGKIDAIKNHMGNFYDCTLARKMPISDVVSQHRSVSVCHLGNISMRLGRALQWDPDAEEFVNDSEANTWLRREQRAGYEVV
ncbi:MAG: gfo/Idh/MocA family oxidoreductase [Planctomycetota bacterium]|nr:MAG: gfo/Idh/MocA family oxidoreductase [Planctomycetota bacterium]REJ96387.1 MAG: gfo/Idh/MocA family oxidoreductase [Planctomycetota bacterium]REK29658.1 MAG: gfo/Idh/MocA family oxidoreductase [Planctomycetota bacterium]REK30522.1 MAG: gfo/Idh/MocA family oxidoreductase [Planctomycetota bacterium]